MSKDEKPSAASHVTDALRDEAIPSEPEPQREDVVVTDDEARLPTLPSDVVVEEKPA